MMTRALGSICLVLTLLFLPFSLSSSENADHVILGTARLATAKTAEHGVNAIDIKNINRYVKRHVPHYDNIRPVVI